MNALSLKSVLSLLLLAVTGAASFAAVGMWVGPKAPVSASAVAAAPEIPVPATRSGEYYIAFNRAATVASARVIYKGYAEKNRIRIDVVIPALDPEMAYVHLLEIPAAREGFSLLGQQYRLTAVNRHRIRIAAHQSRNG